MSSVLIVDCHGMYLTALSMAVAAKFSNFNIRIAHSLARGRDEFDPDGSLVLALIDITTPGASWNAMRSLARQFPQTRLIAMSPGQSRTDALRALENGLSGFVSKAQSDEEILGAITDVLSGRVYVSPALINNVDPESTILEEHLATHHAAGVFDAGKLTPRQRDILPLIARGMSNKEIARALRIAEGTTKIHASRLLRFLGVRNRIEAAIVAQQLIHSDGSVSELNTADVPISVSLRRNG